MPSLCFLAGHRDEIVRGASNDFDFSNHKLALTRILIGWIVVTSVTCMFAPDVKSVACGMAHVYRHQWRVVNDLRDAVVLVVCGRLTLSLDRP